MGPPVSHVAPRAVTKPWGHHCPSQDWHRAVGPRVSLLGPLVSLLGPQMSLTGLAPSCGATGVPSRTGIELWGRWCPSQDSHCALGPPVLLLGPQMSLPGQAPSSGATSVIPGATGVPPRTVTKPEGHPCHSLGRRQWYLLSWRAGAACPCVTHPSCPSKHDVLPAALPTPLSPSFCIVGVGCYLGGAVVAGRGPPVTVSLPCPHRHRWPFCRVSARGRRTSRRTWCAASRCWNMP